MPPPEPVDLELWPRPGALSNGVVIIVFCLVVLHDERFIWIRGCRGEGPRPQWVRRPGGGPGGGPVASPPPRLGVRGCRVGALLQAIVVRLDRDRPVVVLGERGVRDGLALPSLVLLEQVVRRVRLVHLAAHVVPVGGVHPVVLVGGGLAGGLRGSLGPLAPALPFALVPVAHVVLNVRLLVIHNPVVVIVRGGLLSLCRAFPLGLAGRSRRGRVVFKATPVERELHPRRRRRVGGAGVPGASTSTSAAPGAPRAGFEAVVGVLFDLVLGEGVLADRTLHHCARRGRLRPRFALALAAQGVLFVKVVVRVDDP
eukprot:m.289275 g.289275  ORF g.289275 m.289275 type:complete len:313 (-) comp16224_c0_seq3:1810-2748(-)